MYEYACDIVRVIDGDTVVVDIDLGFRLVHRQTIRLVGIDCPEARGECREEGLVAKEHLEHILEQADSYVIETRKAGKYGRYLGTIWTNTDSRSINDRMIDDGFAEKW